MRGILVSIVLAISVLPAGAIDTYDQTLTLQGITFLVQCDNAASLNTLTLTPSGLEKDNSPSTIEVDGVVTAAEVADLNADGSPELYIYIASVGSGYYGSLAIRSFKCSGH